MENPTIIRFYKEVIWGGYPPRLKERWATVEELLPCPSGIPSLLHFARPRGGRNRACRKRLRIGGRDEVFSGLILFGFSSGPLSRAKSYFRGFNRT